MYQRTWWGASAQYIRWQGTDGITSQQMADTVSYVTIRGCVKRIYRPKGLYFSHQMADDYACTGAIVDSRDGD